MKILSTQDLKELNKLYEAHSQQNKSADILLKMGEIVIHDITQRAHRVSAKSIIGVVNRALFKIQKEYSFFYKFISKLNFIYLPENNRYCPTMAVDPNGNIYLNVNFIYNYCNMDVNKVFGILFHELMHILLDHVNRDKYIPGINPRDPQVHKLLNIAADYEVNCSMVADSIVRSEFWNEMKGYWDPKYNGIPYEKIFDKIKDIDSEEEMGKKNDEEIQKQQKNIEDNLNKRKEELLDSLDELGNNEDESSAADANNNDSAPQSGSRDASKKLSNIEKIKNLQNRLKQLSDNIKPGISKKEAELLANSINIIKQGIAQVKQQLNESVEDTISKLDSLLSKLENAFIDIENDKNEKTDSKPQDDFGSKTKGTSDDEVSNDAKNTDDNATQDDIDNLKSQLNDISDELEELNDEISEDKNTPLDDINKILDQLNEDLPDNDDSDAIRKKIDDLKKQIDEVSKKDDISDNDIDDILDSVDDIFNDSAVEIENSVIDSQSVFDNEIPGEMKLTSISSSELEDILKKSDWADDMNDTDIEEVSNSINTEKLVATDDDRDEAIDELQSKKEDSYVAKTIEHIKNSKLETQSVDWEAQLEQALRQRSLHTGPLKETDFKKTMWGDKKHAWRDDISMPYHPKRKQTIQNVNVFLDCSGSVLSTMKTFQKMLVYIFELCKKYQYSGLTVYGFGDTSNKKKVLDMIDTNIHFDYDEEKPEQMIPKLMDHFNKHWTDCQAGENFPILFEYIDKLQVKETDPVCVICGDGLWSKFPRRLSLSVLDKNMLSKCQFVIFDTSKDNTQLNNEVLTVVNTIRSVNKNNVVVIKNAD